MKIQNILAIMILGGCASAVWIAPPDITSNIIDTGKYRLQTYSRISDTTSPIHIYIEGDGNSFDAYGHPTSDPTPRGTLLRDMMTQDTAANVAYIARPCQYIMSEQCTLTDWTTGRFAPAIIESVANAIQKIAQNRDIILIGYSGGALISGLIINQYPQINIKQWITIAGVLNHHDWTEYFGDVPLTESADLTALPDIPQIHYIAPRDSVVPNSLSKKWTRGKSLISVPNARHHKFPNFEINFTKLDKH